ncbi:MAG: hypothetical protein IT364_02925 [Candidatus Hydrogenedentes bacterium]|nr:hypothetical protein [Candidatus Hydrogenedentota bacterium]
MYAKIFQQIYDSSVCEDWQVMITFQQLLILANQDGVVDMTPEAISRRTNIPLKIISHGIRKLEQPDPRSRSGDMEGRRVVLIDNHRDWGWWIVNYQHYRELAKAEEKREADRVRIAAKRADGKPLTINNVATCRTASQGVAKDRGSEAYTEAKEEKISVAHATRFPEFWQAYPRHENQKRARDIWRRKRLDSKADAIIADIHQRTASHRPWLEGFIPHATTYLNGERWNDAIDNAGQAAAGREDFSGAI